MVEDKKKHESFEDVSHEIDSDKDKESTEKKKDSDLKERNLEEISIKKNSVSKEKEYLEGWKRCRADFENFKKRQLDSQKEMIQYSTESIIMQILPVIDNFHASTEHIPENQKDNPWVVGIMYIQKQLDDVLISNNVTELTVKIGDVFDPHIHEAIDQKSNQQTDRENDKDDTGKQKSDENKQDRDNNTDIVAHTIAKIVQKGYKNGEKVLRPARVIIE